ncbi:hypothetical protein, partial [Streptomyces ipomoeae]|uniref:hypothetical protein n=1 Tax=Streptomyces ipomoeae TaxID=103232 RepID=UPI0029A4D3A3
GERGYPRRLRRRDHTSHTKIISPVTSSYGTTLSEQLGGTYMYDLKDVWFQVCHNGGSCTKLSRF